MLSNLAFLLEGSIIIYTTALALMFGLTAVYAVSAAVGFGIELEENTPQTYDIEFEHGSLETFTNWSNINKVPLMVYLAIFLFSFGNLGILLSLLVGWLLGFYLIFPITLILSVIFAKYVSGVVGKMVPKVTTNAISFKSFIGSKGKITIGEASLNNPAEAKIVGVDQKNHYIFVEPENGADPLIAGDTIEITRIKDEPLKIFYAKAL
jgi:hypothetical protein